MEKRKSLDINDFVYLLLAEMARNSRIIDFKYRSRKIISLPVQYKQIIANILCAENGWLERFSVLIDTEEYFCDHFAWEEKLSLTIKKVLIDLNKTFEYDFVYDRLLISFTEEEVDVILLQYPDEELKDVMEHFANLLVNYIYTREYQERYHDYYAETVLKMHDMIISKNDKKRVKGLRF